MVYRFCKSGCSDGYNPTGNLILDANGNLLGTTPGGGANTAGGVVFKLTTGGKETVRYSFCALANCADGRGAYGSLLKIGSALYGTTFYGGTSTGNGTAYQLSGTTLTTLKIFCEKASCADGTYPDGDLITDGAGNIYGLTSSGGGGSGIAFELSP